VRLEQAGRERTWALVSARAEGISIRNPGHGGRAVALPGAPARSGAGLDALDAALGELRAAGWPAPEDPGSDGDAELDGRDGIADPMSDKVDCRPLRLLVPAAWEPLPGPADTNPPYPLVAPIAGDEMLLTGVRKDGDTFPVQVTRAPVTARTGQFTLAVIRDGAGPDPAARKRYLEGTLGSITGSIFEVGLKLNASSDAPPGDLRRRLDEASRLLDGIVNEIYAAVFRAYRPRA
jgi:hypothetical protein